MRLLLIVHSVAWKGGGAYFHALHIADGLAKLGYSVDIMATSGNSRVSIKRNKLREINIYEFPDILKGAARNGWDPYNTLVRILFLFGKKYDIVHLLDTRPVVIFPGLFAKYVKKSKLVIEWLDWFGKGGTATERSKILRFFMAPIETFFEEKFRKYADGSIGLGVPLTKRAKEFAPNSKLLTITHGCDVLKIKNYDLNYARNKLNLKNKTFYIGYAGRMREDVIIRLNLIIKELNDRNLPSNCNCILIGNSAFNYRKYLSSEVLENFISTGWVDYETINYYLSSCDLLILPFDSNSIARNGIWPSKFNDYLSVGRPILSTKLDVLDEVFRKTSIGFMVEDKIESLVIKTEEILLNRVLASEMGNNSRKLAENELSWESITHKINMFYLGLL